MAFDHQPPLSFENISPLLMPPSQYNAIIPNYRRPYSTPGSTKRSSVRVSKPTIHGHSPHHVQRRRTTATQPNREVFTGISSRIRNQRPRPHEGATYPVLDTRPYSWHPDADVSFFDNNSSPADRHCIGTAIAGLQNLAMDSSPSHPVEPTTNDIFSMNYNQCLPPGRPSQRQPQYHEYYSQQFPYVVSSEAIAQSELQSQGSNFQHVPQDIYAFQHAPTPFHNQGANSLELYNNTELQQPCKDEGDELVGIGLYDDKVQGGQRVRPEAARKEMIRESNKGKELKLEESWQPPESLENDEDSSEEAEEPTSASTTFAPEFPPMVYPANGDLSGQSFFFSEDEGQGQAFANYLAFPTDFGQPLDDQWKTGQPVGPGQNFMYV